MSDFNMFSASFAYELSVDEWSVQREWPGQEGDPTLDLPAPVAPMTLQQSRYVSSSLLFVKHGNLRNQDLFLFLALSLSFVLRLRVLFGVHYENE